jgi:branched-chain amino acid transport system permease protein
VAALRRGRFGRRLIALRDSEAAYATLGGSLLVAKVLVFALAAGIAGLGGALYGMQQQSVTAEQFNLLAGLPIFLVAVVGGLGAVGGGLFTGTALIGPINVLVAVAPWSQNLVAMMPGLAGLGLGHYPDGVVAGLRGRWEPVVRDRIALAALVCGLGLAYALWLVGAVNGWVFFGGSVVLALALRGWATTRQAARAATAEAAAVTGGAEPDIPVEWWGVRRAWRAGDEEVLAHGIAAN